MTLYQTVERRIFGIYEREDSDQMPIAFAVILVVASIVCLLIITAYLWEYVYPLPGNEGLLVWLIVPVGFTLFVRYLLNNYRITE